MAKKMFYKQDNRLMTPWEAKSVKPNRTRKKVYLEKSDYLEVECVGRTPAYDNKFGFADITAKDLRSKKLRKHLMELGCVW